MTVPLKKLGDVAEFIRGITFTPNDVVDNISENNIGVMRTKNVQQFLDLADVWRIDKSFVKNPKQYLCTGDLLVSSANSWNLVGKAAWVPELGFQSTFGGFVTVLRGNESIVDKRYLYYWFVSEKIQELLRSFANKTTNISNLNLKRALDLKIPLPPLAEQKRIAALLDKADNVLRLREKAIGKLDELAQSVFIEMFGNPVFNSKNIPTKSVKEICKLINGRAFKPTEWRDSGMPIIRIQNLNDESKNFNFTDQIFDDKYLVKKGNILFSWSGTPGTSFGCFKWMRADGWLNQHIFKVELNEKEVLPDFFIMQMNLKLSELIAQAHGGVGLQHVTKSMVDDLVLLIPPMAEQIKFCERLARISDAKNKGSVSLQKSNSMRQSLQHQSFVVN